MKPEIVIIRGQLITKDKGKDGHISPMEGRDVCIGSFQKKKKKRNPK